MEQLDTFLHNSLVYSFALYIVLPGLLIYIGMTWGYTNRIDEEKRKESKRLRENEYLDGLVKQRIYDLLISVKKMPSLVDHEQTINK